MKTPDQYLQSSISEMDCELTNSQNKTIENLHQRISELNQLQRSVDIQIKSDESSLDSSSLQLAIQQIEQTLIDLPMTQHKEPLDAIPPQFAQQTIFPNNIYNRFPPWFTIQTLISFLFLPLVFCSTFHYNTKIPITLTLF